MSQPGSNPYIGLRPFEEEDSQYFFGRRKQTAELLERLYDGRFLAVLGSSGCGKSSLIRAGLIPALQGGFLVEDRDQWRIAIMKPGDRPLDNFARALCAESDDHEALKARIIEDHTQAVIDYLGRHAGAGVNQLILVDQFEEIFNFRGTERAEQFVRRDADQSRELARRRVDAAEFVDLMIALSQNGGTRYREEEPGPAIYVTLTMRTDFLGDCDLFYGLPEAINHGRYLVPRLTRQQLRQAIEGPALLEGAQLASRLLDRLLNKLGDRTDRLPVLQHALLRTWEIWQRRGRKGPIDLEHYKDAGTLSRALSQHADEALEGVDPEATARIFKCLTDTDLSYRQVRRPAALEELVAVSGEKEEDVKAILDRFAEDGRHFVYYDPEVENPQVDISHESLIRQWQTLRQWVDEERESRDRYRELVIKARRKQANQANWLRGSELRIVRDWWKKARPDAIWARRYQRKENDFGEARKFLSRSRTRANRNLGMVIGLTVALILVLAGFLAWAVHSRQVAVTARLKAQDQARVALASEWLQKDPTRAALVLLELAEPAQTPYAMQRMYGALSHQLAEVELKQDRGKVRAVALSPDGTRAVTAYSDGTARIWDTASWTPVQELEAGEDLLSASFGPDGRQIVAVSFDERVRIWDAASGGLVQELEGVDGRFVNASFSPDGSRIVTASFAGTAEVWDLASGELVQRLAGHQDEVSSASFDPSGSRVVTASSDKSARIWEVATGATVHVLEGHVGRIRSASFSPDGSSIVTASEDWTARVWEASSGRQTATLREHAGAVFSASFSPGGEWVVTASNDRMARLWDASSGDRLSMLQGHGDLVSLASFGPGGSWIMTASHDGTARIWKNERAGQTWLPPPTELAKLEHRGEVLVASFSPDGSRIVTATESEDSAVRIWDPASGDPVVLPGEGHTASLSLDGAHVVTGTRTARVWDVAGRRLAQLHDEGEDLPAGNLLSASFSPDGTWVLVVSREAVWLWGWQPGSTQRLELVPGSGEFQAACFSRPDGARVATATSEGTVRILDAASGKELARRDGISGWINAVVFSPDGTRLAIAADVASVWDPAAAEPDGLIELGHRDPVSAVDFSPDGSRVVTASDDGTAYVWDALTGKKLTPLGGHLDALTAASFSPDGSRVVTASDDRTARIWDAVSGAELARLEGQERALTTASFSPDGTRVVTASADGSVRVWLARAEPLQAWIRGLTILCLGRDFRAANLGETPEVAEKKSRACERCVADYPRGGVDVSAYRDYKQCLEQSAE